MWLSPDEHEALLKNQPKANPAAKCEACNPECKRRALFLREKLKPSPTTAQTVARHFRQLPASGARVALLFLRYRRKAIAAFPPARTERRTKQNTARAFASAASRRAIRDSPAYLFFEIISTVINKR